jgi:hypothetical protein
MDIDVAFTRKYSRVSISTRNVNVLEELETSKRRIIIG